MANSNTGLSNSEKQALFADARAALNDQQFNHLVATAAVLPIAEQIVETALVRNMFQTDRFDNGPAIPYNLKKRQSKAGIIARYGLTPSFITRYSKILVEPYIITHKPEISVIDIMDANFNVIGDILDDAGKEIAIKEDTEMLRILDAGAPDPGSPPSSTSTFVVSAGPGGLGNVLDRNTLQVGSSATAPAGGVTGDPGVKDILTAKTALRETGYEPETSLMNPYGLGKFLGQDLFLQYLQAGNREVMDTGYLQNMVGEKLVWSRLVPRKTIYVMETAELARWVERNALSVEARTQELVSTWFMWERVCPFMKNANAYVRILFTT